MTLQPMPIETLRAVAAAFPTRTLGALVFPGFQALDLWGPLEIFGDTSPAVRPILVSALVQPVPSAQGPWVVADFTLDDCPRLDLLLIPGGDVIAQKADTYLIEWVRCRSLDAEIVMSVCNGADLLAQTGLLDGRRATTNKALFRSIAAAHPGVEWVAQARWVEDGKFITSSGVAAGIDMSLGVIARIAGEDVAEGLAAYAEYDWHRNASWDPFSEVHGLQADGGQRYVRGSSQPGRMFSPGEDISSRKDLGRSTS